MQWVGEGHQCGSAESGTGGALCLFEYTFVTPLSNNNVNNISNGFLDDLLQWY
jgi:hypothetical protein